MLAVAIISSFNENLRGKRIRRIIRLVSDAVGCIVWIMYYFLNFGNSDRQNLDRFFLPRLSSIGFSLKGYAFLQLLLLIFQVKLLNIDSSLFRFFKDNRWIQFHYCTKKRLSSPHWSMETSSFLFNLLYLSKSIVLITRPQYNSRKLNVQCASI